MILIERKPLPNPESTELKRWLQDPACLKFQAFLSQMAAQHAADAGNSVIKGDDDDIVEAKENAKMARIYIGANKIIDDIRRSNYIFEIPQLKHQIPTLPDNG